MRFGISQTKPNWLFVGLGLGIISMTYAFLIVTGASGLIADENYQVPEITGNTNALIALVGYLLGAGLIVVGVARQFTTSTYALMPVAIALNIVIGEIVARVGAPFALAIYLDSIGTVLVAVLAGPLAGAATGGLANIIWGFFNPVALPFAITAIMIGLLAGTFAQLGWFRRFYLVPIAGLITGIIAAILSAPLAAFIFGGVTGAGTDAVVAAFRAAGASIFEATLGQGLLSDPLDKVLTFSIAYLVITALPMRFRSRLGQSGAAADKLPR